MNIQSEVVEMLTQSALIRFTALARKRAENVAAFMPASSFLQDANPIEGAT
jgi:hypothetical protein